MDIFFGKCLNKQLRYLVFLFCLLSCRKITSGKEARIQRRFMWKQMHMDNFVSDMATRAYAMKHLLSDLVPTSHSVVPSKLLDYLPSETTRVKYIIRNPTTKKPIKIIKMRPNKKVIKIIPKPTVSLDTMTTLSQEKTVPTYLSSDQMEKLEKEQELIAEGQYPHKIEDDELSHISEDEKYKQPSKQEMDDQQNGWLPVVDTSNIVSSSLSAKPISSLHTSIMAEALPKPEKHIAESPFLTNYGQDSTTYQQSHDSLVLQNYYDQGPQTNGYEVTENIAEESIALPLTQGSRINVRIGSAPPRHSVSQSSSNVGSRDKFTPTTPASVSTEEPPNYPPNFLRRFQDRSNAAAVSPSPGATSSAAVVRSKQRKNIAEFSTDWTPKMTKNMSSTRESFKFRARFQGLPPRIKSEKWPPEVENLSPLSHSKPDRFSSSEISTEIKSSVHSSTTAATLLAESRQQSGEPSAGRSRKQPLSIPMKTRQAAELPKLRDMRVHNRGKIKFGDKIL
ncbi:PREDICTED: uncharacterized protein LOC108363081 [Rhagoletis zephyria]|uniref:uncharacterized protein LOC108363081 n=1 Tax=Rhagoletis zephyria TaxID=28612 RepID=UPI000811573D|nr:PREDICTED: uncharacterized protein LOC108363081 [Rhagoletis zephyria]